jgi:group I intron endonuclease
MKICGIYQIINIIDNKKYIGQSINIKRRWTEHKRDLKKNKHKNLLLQRAWNKYGCESFKFEILVICNKKQLKQKEKETVEKILETKRYNILKNYDSLAGSNNPFYGKTHTKSVKEKLSKLAKNRTGFKNGNYGNKYSNITKIKAGHNKKTKLTNDQVIKIIKMKNITHQKIADIYGVSRTMITRIKNGTRWGLITNINKGE